MVQYIIVEALHTSSPIPHPDYYSEENQQRCVPKNNGMYEVYKEKYCKNEKNENFRRVRVKHARTSETATTITTTSSTTTTKTTTTATTATTTTNAKKCYQYLCLNTRPQTLPLPLEWFSLCAYSRSRPHEFVQRIRLPLVLKGFWGEYGALQAANSLSNKG